MNKKFIKEILNVNKYILKLNVELKKYNTMRLQSKCHYFITPRTFIELKKVIMIASKHKIKYYILGNGSNIIFTSKDKDCIIKLDFPSSKYIEIINASELLSQVASRLINNSYSGLEYISTIPATIGGAILMNAGAYDHYISDIISYVYYFDCTDFKIKVISKGKCNFGYRNSIFKDRNMVILGCKIELCKADIDVMKKIVINCIEKRKKSQPLDYPNCGSIFKNPSNYKAWELIEKVGLKGYGSNGASISEKHANFIVNKGNSKGENILEIIEIIKEKVHISYGIELKEEIIVID